MRISFSEQLYSLDQLTDIMIPSIIIGWASCINTSPQSDGLYTIKSIMSGFMCYTSEGNFAGGVYIYYMDFLFLTASTCIHLQKKFNIGRFNEILQHRLYSCLVFHGILIFEANGCMRLPYNLCTYIRAIYIRAKNQLGMYTGNKL